MASKVIFSVVAVLGIAAASGGAWWHLNKPKGPQEITAANSTGASGAPRPGAAASAPRAAGVEVAQAERTRLQDDAPSVGTLRSRQSVMMRPEVAGRVKAIGFSDGATVRRGQLLVQLDDTLQRAEIKQAQAQVSIAQANLRRNQELVAQNFVAQRVLEESAANLQVAEAQLALVCARLSRMAITAPFDGTVGMRNVNLGDFVKDGADLINLEDIGSMYVDFRLPERYQGKLRLRGSVELQLDSFPGRIFKATIEAIDPLLDVNGRSVGVRAVLPNTMGEAMVQGAPRASAPSGAASAARPAGAAAAQATRPRNTGAGAAPRPAAAPAGSPPGQGAVADAARPAPARPAVDAGGCPLPETAVAAGRPNAPEANRGGAGNAAPLRPGMFARVNTVFSVKESAIVVPEEAIVPQGGRQFVFKVVASTQLPGAPEPAPDGKFVSLRQEVKLGPRQFGKVEILEGLAEGETVVVAGHQRLQRDGTPVRVVDLVRPQAAGAPAGAASAAVPPLSASALSASAAAASR